MTRDDSKGGWVPLGGGGMSVIGLCRSVSIVRDEMMIEFLIYGRRIADKSVRGLAFEIFFCFLCLYNLLHLGMIGVSV